jgi:hypothetical protein
MGIVPVIREAAITMLDEVEVPDLCTPARSERAGKVMRGGRRDAGWQSIIYECIKEREIKSTVSGGGGDMPHAEMRPSSPSGSWSAIS